MVSDSSDGVVSTPSHGIAIVDRLSELDWLVEVIAETCEERNK